MYILFPALSIAFYLLTFTLFLIISERSFFNYFPCQMGITMWDFCIFLVLTTEIKSCINYLYTLLLIYIVYFQRACFKSRNKFLTRSFCLVISLVGGLQLYFSRIYLWVYILNMGISQQASNCGAIRQIGTELDMGDNVQSSSTLSPKRNATFLKLPFFWGGVQVSEIWAKCH